MPFPLLFLSDAADSRSGLGRITRDLATLTSTLPAFTTASLGRGALCSSRFPWMQYSYPPTLEGQWGEAYLQPSWRDFTRNQPGGAIMSIWDASRLLWFSRPDAGGLSPALTTFLGPQRTYAKWGYFPIDSSGPDSRILSAESRAVLQGFDRVVVASEWAAGIVRASGIACEWIPHGLDLHTFRVVDEQERAYRRDVEGVAGRVVVGSVMTNQARKDFPALFHAISLLRYAVPGLLLWLHTDTDINYWNVHALAADYGIADIIKLTYTGEFNDRRMAAFYSVCDVTALISGGEGFGYPICESLACGTPCITQSWAAGAELTLPEFLFDPLCLRVDTSHNCLRAVHDGPTIAQKLGVVLEKARVEGHGWRVEIAGHVQHLSWKLLKTVWQRWFAEGLEKC